MRSLLGLILAAAPVFPAILPSAPDLPLFFFPNTGQTDPAVQFIVQTPDLSARFRRDRAIFQAQDRQITVRFAGANPNAAIEGVNLLAAKINFFLGSSGWKTDVPSYSKIVYRELYPGIDMTYGGTGRQLKSEFLVGPGANPSLIRLEYSEPVSIDAQGNLLAGADFQEAVPEIYQQIGSQRVKVAGRYRLLDGHTAGFEIDSYDASAPLVIDPTVSYCTYLGGSAPTSITGVAVDTNSNLYVTGWTAALNFPIDGAYQASNQGGVDAIVAKLNPTGSALLYATYIGGRSGDQGAAIAVDSLGQAYVTGSTSSSNFPLVLSNRSALGGSTAAFALKLNAAGNTLLYSGYLGGTVYELGTAIAVDANFNAYIAGNTESSNFPVLNPTQTYLGGGTDAFVTKLNSSGAITFSTYLGGNGNEAAGGIAVDSSGNIFVAGTTASGNFPVVAAYQSALSGSEDAFLAKISSANTVVFSTYLGGSGGTTQQGTALALDSAGNPYLAGVTTSANFPVTPGAFQASLSGLQNAFLTKMTSTGTLVYSTYLGGSSFDGAYGIAVSVAGNAYVAGYTSSVDFPQLAAVQAFSGLYDAFVTELNFSGTALVFSTYYGGSGSDYVYAIALDKFANIYVGGQTSSSNLPLVSPIQSSNLASSSGWLLRLSSPPATLASVSSVSPASGTGISAIFTAQYGDTGGASIINAASILLNTTPSPGSGCFVSYSAVTNLFSIYNDAGTAVLATVTPGSGSASNDQCVINGAGSSATVSGNTLTVIFSLTFQIAFAGLKTVYLEAADPNSNTGLVAEGSFTLTVPAGTPQVVSVSPSSSTGSGQTFVATYLDTVVASGLSAVALLVKNSVSQVSACSVVYTLSTNTVSLATDSGSGTTSMLLGSMSTLQNSQCIVGATSMTQTGQNLAFTVTLSFKPAFNGLQNIYLEATTTALSTGYLLEGAYAAGAGSGPVANSAVPGSGSGPGERFSFTVSDTAGAGFIKSAAILFSSSFNFINACSLVWDGTGNTISLSYDNPANGQTPLTPGMPGIATNDECTMNAANSTIVMGATQVVITLELTFNSTFFGPKNIYLYASEATSNSGWAVVGNWTVTGGASTANSVSPNSGSGQSPTFTFTVSDSSSQTNLAGMTMLITTGAPIDTANACSLVFNSTAATIGLWDDTGNTTLSVKGLGSSATLQNSQCAIGYTVNNISGNSFQFSIQVVFNTTNFAGVKSVYLQANEPSTNSGLVYVGTWTVP